MHIDGSQTCIDCWQLSADHGAHLWAFANLLIPRNAHGLYRYQVFFLDTAWMACAQRAGVRQGKYVTSPGQQPGRAVAWFLHVYQLDFLFFALQFKCIVSLFLCVS
jgi:hypothetical protein